MAKRQKREARRGRGGGAAGNSRQHKATKPNSRDPEERAASQPKAKSASHVSHPQHTEPTIPFAPEDKILLVGDGDLSFSASLVEHHYCADVTATVLEKSQEELLEKYPHAAENIAKIEAEGSRVLFDVDATKMAPFVEKPPRKEKRDPAATGPPRPTANTEPMGIMDRIIFNFPHVGGKSTDVNRQVRYNQELLVAFFKRAAPSLAPGGCIVVTLFEGEPYTLWNVRDLARHTGLRVERSFRFQADAYPGYHHARTLGVVKGKDGKEGAGWKGEDRPARSYVFVRKDDESRPLVQPGKKRKRAKGQDSDSSDED
ncbi:hypothetical protein F4780DRAFT_610919 [Xylariomycetidae sp. FL0641]|nr:hypothetical protein F4780DRAFT_610919 [Xylariomycetidae sp. FL0641]